MDTDVVAQSEKSSPFSATALLLQSKRLFWLVMLLFHVGAIRAAWTNLTGDTVAIDWAVGGLRLVVLVASAAFFALKIADVACLRLKPGWRPLIASVVVAALLHVNVLHRAVESDSPYSPAPVAALAVVGTLLESLTLRRGLLRVVRIAFGGDGGITPATSKSCFYSLQLRELRTPLQIMLVTELLLPRPPPSL